MTHATLVALAERWLTRQGCGIVLRDPFHTPYVPEHPDALGWRLASDVSILVECKASRADFLADRTKPFRANPDQGIGQWRFYLTPAEIVQVQDLPPRWGLLWATNRGVRMVHGRPPGNTGWGAPPFVANIRAERRLLLAALRRLALRGHLPEVYTPIPTADESLC
jgi:hypothetical protein